MDDFPKGFPQHAAFISSDDSFVNFRRFDRLFARVALHLQSDLTDLEKELDELDEADAGDPIMEKRLRGFENYDGWNTKQRELVSKIGDKWIKYSTSPTTCIR